jgi:ABC-2 type transport system ATP-binding protein
MTGVNGDPVVRAVGLTMRFGSITALENASFSVYRGEILGLLGRNGAGKTTTMRILTTYLVPSSGSATVAGYDILDQPHEVRRRIGYLPESVPVYQEMEVLEYLTFVGKGRDLFRDKLKSRIDWVAQACNIIRVLRRPIGELSKGFRQRVAMAQAMIHDPEILILDEPTSGLDPVQIRGVRDLIRDLAKTKTVIISTHILQEIEALTRRMVIIDEGHVVADGTPEDLFKKTKLTAQVRLQIEGNPPKDVEIMDALRGLTGVTDVRMVEVERPQTLGFAVSSGPGEQVVPSIIAKAGEAGWSLIDLRVEEPRLEQAFSSLVGQAKL